MTFVSFEMVFHPDRGIPEDANLKCAFIVNRLLFDVKKIVRAPTGKKNLSPGLGRVKIAYL
ncbi:MAG: hypothetical protein JRL30_12645 [Deltaproteobacteria bacterium]|nr:hypothetical protein [Deltaproteobacteria bacterium]